MPRTLTNLRYHFAFATKDHEALITPVLRERLHSYIAGIITRRKGVALEVNGSTGHVHALVSLPAHEEVADIMKAVKGGSAFWVNNVCRPEYEFGWQPGYYAFTVSASQTETVRTSIRAQAQGQCQRSFRDEMLLLLESHGLTTEYIDKPTTHACLRYHLIFATKNREPSLLEDLKRQVYAEIARIASKERGEIVEINGMPDHIHILVTLPPTVTVANLMQSIKGGSSRWINRCHLLDYEFHWQDGYGAFTVSECLVDKVRAYIANQEQHHKTRSHEDEMRLLAKRHGLQSSPRPRSGLSSSQRDGR